MYFKWHILRCIQFLIYLRGGFNWNFQSLRYAYTNWFFFTKRKLSITYLSLRCSPTYSRDRNDIYRRCAILHKSAINLHSVLRQQKEKPLLIYRRLMRLKRNWNANVIPTLFFFFTYNAYNYSYISIRYWLFHFITNGSVPFMIWWID